MAQINGGPGVDNFKINAAPTDNFNGFGGTDSLTMVAAGADTDFDTRSSTLVSVEKLISEVDGTRFTVDQADLAKGGSIIGSNGTNEVAFFNGGTFDLTSTTLTNIQHVIGGDGVTNFVVDLADITFVTIAGGGSTDSLKVKGTNFDLSSTVISDIDQLIASSNSPTKFTLDNDDFANLSAVAGGATITGGTGKDTVFGFNANMDFSSIALSSIEILQANTDTLFIVNQNDLAKGGSIIGSDSSDALHSADESLDLTSTTLAKIEEIGGSSASNFHLTLDAADLTVLSNRFTSTGDGHIDGDFATQNDILVKSTTIDLTKIQLSGIDSLGSTLPGALTFKFSENTLGGSDGITINGGAGIDTIVGAAGDGLDLNGAILNSIEKLTTNATGFFTFTVDGSQLKAGGGSLTSITGANNNFTDTLQSGDYVDLTQTTLSSIEVILGTGDDQVFFLDQADLAKNGTVDGNGGGDTLKVKSAVVDLSATTLLNIDLLQGIHTGVAETFKLGANAIVNGDTGGGGTIEGSTANDTVIATGTLLDLTSTDLSSIERLTTNNAIGTEFLLDDADLDNVTSFTGSSGKDSVFIGTDGQNTVDFSSRTFLSIEGLGVDTGIDTAITVSHSQLLAMKSITGNFGFDDSLSQGDNTDFNLTSLTLTSVEELLGSTGNNTFTLDLPDLADIRHITGDTSTDTVTVKNALVDLGSVELSSIEHIRSTITNQALTFRLNSTTLDNSATPEIHGNVGKNDTIVAAGDIVLDLTSATLTSVEILKAENGDRFIINDTFFAANGGGLASVIGTSNNNDTLEVNGSKVDLTKTTLTGVDELIVNGTTITLDAADLVSKTQILQSITDTSTDLDTVLQVKSTTIDLSFTELQGIDVVKTFAQPISAPVTFILSDVTLLNNGPDPITFFGSTGNDILKVSDTQKISDTVTIDLSSAVLSSVETLLSDPLVDTQFVIKDSVLAANGGSVKTVTDPAGIIGSDQLLVVGTDFNLYGTTLNGIEILVGDLGGANTTFSLDAADLFFKSGSKVAQSLDKIFGTADTADIVQVNSNTIDLSAVEFSDIEILQADPGITGPITFILGDKTLDIPSGSQFILGGAATDTLKSAHGVDLSNVDLSSIEKLVVTQTTGADSQYTVNDFDFGGADGVTQVIGNPNSKADSVLIIDTGDVDLTSTTFTAIDEIDLTGGFNLTIAAATLGVGAITVAADTLEHLILKGSGSFDISKAHFVNFDSLTLDNGGGNVAVSVSQDNILGFASINGDGGDDTLVATGTELDLNTNSTSLTSIEALATSNSAGTTFTVTNGQLVGLAATAGSGFGSVTGSAGADTLVVFGTVADLTTTTVSSLETLKAGDSNMQLFVIDNVDDLASLKVIDGFSVGNGVALDLVASGDFDLSHTKLLAIDILNADAVATTFTLDQTDIFSKVGLDVVQQLTEINGGGDTNTLDTIVANGTVLDLRGVTLTDIDAISANHTKGVQYGLDGNAQGIELDLGTNTNTDKVTLDVGYIGAFEITNADDTVLSIDHFTHTVDVIDLSALATHGSATFDNNPFIQATVDAEANLEDALNALAHAANGSVNSQVLSFEFGGDTYIMVDNTPAGPTEDFDDTQDTVIKLVGTGLGLTGSDFVLN